VYNRGVCAEQAFPSGPTRRADAEQWVGERLREWDVRAASTGRWLAAAQETLEDRRELVVYAEWDRALLLFSLEIRQRGRLVYGIDDWLG
jgi:hypothetical protein